MRKVISDCPVPLTVASPSAEPHASAAFKRAHEGREYVVPKGHFVLAAPGFSQVDPAIWGADAAVFDESRWLAGDGKGTVPGEEDEGEEDYGFGNISKGGKSACEFCPLLFCEEGKADCRFFRCGSQTCLSELDDTVALGSNLPTYSLEQSSRRLSGR
jgi:hypothetical protein